MVRARRFLGGGVLLVLLLAALVPLQMHLTKLRRPAWNRPSMAYLPQGETIKPWLMGYHTTIASYLWIRTMLYFGEHATGDQDFTWLVHMVDMVTRLNPHFYPAYEFAGLILPEKCDASGAGRVILQRGLTTFGNRNWRIPFYLGWIYYRHEGDTALAAEYIAMAGHSEGVPPYIAGFSATLFTRTGQTERAQQYLVALHAAVQNPAVRAVVRKKLDQLAP
jgi:hypothetical protein